MEINSLKKGLETWKYFLFINIGASITLLATGLAELPNLSKSYFPGWYGVWFVVQLASLLPGFILLLGKHWIQIPLRDRLHTIFGYFVITLVNVLSIGLRMDPKSANPLNFFLLGCVLTIGFCYWWLRRKSLGIQNEMFP
jgi:hypothetical protein